MKNILVTGAAGFLGSHLMLHHLRQGDCVLGLDNFTSSKSKSLQIDLISEFKRGLVTFHDIASIHHEHLDRAIYDFRSFVNGMGKEGKFDVIYNFACPASPPRYQAIPVETMMTCTFGTKNMLDLAKSHEAVLVHASTSEIYGDPETSPQRESYRGSVNSYGPRSCYDEGKRAAEALCFDYLHKYKTDARLVRIFNTYGPHMDPEDGRVVSNFIVQALKGLPLTVYGHGQQTRSFCYVDDLIRGIVALGELPANPLTPINLGNPNEFKVIELAERVAQKLRGGQLTLKREAMPIDDPRQRCPDITVARDLLGWEPRVQLVEGLDQTIEYFRKVTV